MAAVLRRTVPRGAVVAVASVGSDWQISGLDARLITFPRSGASTSHMNRGTLATELEAIRTGGAEFLVLPPTALAWLDSDFDFRRQVETHYRLLVHDADTCFIYAALNARRGDATDVEAAPCSNGTETDAGPRQDGSNEPSCLPPVDAAALPELRLLFDQDFYEQQARQEFATADDALHHYLGSGLRFTYDPHPLFDSAYYVATHPDVVARGINPLIDFVARCRVAFPDPNPYFDTAYYYHQDDGLLRAGVNALIHYATHAANNQAYRPNPFFGNGFYLTTYSDVAASGSNPLAHYLQFGSGEARLLSPEHQRIANDLRRFATRNLLRGQWKRGRVLALADPPSSETTDAILELGEALAREQRLETIVIFRDNPDRTVRWSSSITPLVLPEYQIEHDITRMSAVRMLVKALQPMSFLFGISMAPEGVAALRHAGIPPYALVPGAPQSSDRDTLDSLVRNAHRVLVRSSTTFHQLADALGYYPARVGLWPTQTARAGRQHATDAAAQLHAAAPLGELARRDFHLKPSKNHGASGLNSGRRILIPCSDWSISGVNTSLEALARQLLHRGWDVELVFTRGSAAVLASAGGQQNMPRVPYRFLEADTGRVEQIWEALVSDVEDRAPCILFMAYDFVANAVAPALSDAVGVVMWVQADDGDYYEQAYRLGRYCNAVVCVSERIQHEIEKLNPLVSSRSRVIHNSSVSRQLIPPKRRSRGQKLNLVYTGRLVQYQKRILDYVEFARALDERTTDYTLTLIGEFSEREGISGRFHDEALAHLEDGRIRLAGRLSKSEIFAELRDNAFFVLLSEFEGLPLALVEGMACGCVPVVGDTLSGIPEVITNGENGLIVSGRDYSRWADAIITCWSSPQHFLRLSRGATDTVRSRFTVERVARDFDDLFGRVATEAASGRWQRPPSLHWGEARSLTGDVLPPPSLYRPAPGPLAQRA
jgi:glycosyltransferase involved in cell wall biosynthesis